MLRPYRIQTVYLDDFGPIGQSAKYVHFHTRTHFLAACSVENASPSSQLKLYHCLSDLTEPLAAKLPCLGTFSVGRFDLRGVVQSDGRIWSFQLCRWTAALWSMPLTDSEAKHKTQTTTVTTSEHDRVQTCNLKSAETWINQGQK